MPATPFTRSQRALRADGARRSLWVIAAAAAFLVAWTGWFLLAPVVVYAVSHGARIVVDRSAHPIEAALAGRIASIAFDLGDEVREGEILFTLDSEMHRLQLAEERARLASLDSQLEALADQIAALTEARGEAAQAGAAALEEAERLFESLQLSAGLAKEEFGRLQRLREAGGASEFELSKARVEAEKTRIAVEGHRVTLQRIALDQRILDHDRSAAIYELRRESRRVSGDSLTQGAAIARLEHEITRHAIPAPTGGVLGKLADVGRGSMVRSGERLGTVVSPGRLKVIADFEPEAALGRIRLGQPARLRLDGFPWSQYGTLSASVASTASEIREGRVRVEFTLATEQNAAIPVQHALPGTIEVAVETVTPARLVLRHAGRWVGARPDRAGAGGR